ncbi:MAG: hypothetical protein ACI845_000934 [Gammaproteobacteria bacterium]|jgi:hypothetical protein
MDMDSSRIFFILLFLVVGITLFRWAIVTRLQMEQEVKGGRKVLWNNIFPYWNSKDFSEKGNSLRKKYNIIYFLLIVYSLTLISFMKTTE